MTLSESREETPLREQCDGWGDFEHGFRAFLRSGYIESLRDLTKDLTASKPIDKWLY
jgi:hypothetical protein